MTIKDSKVVKGIAILSMIFYHLFNNVETVAERGYTGFYGKYSLLEMVAGAGHICVALFIFVMAYGITIKTKKADCDLKESMRAGGTRYFSLVKRVSYSLVFMFLLSVLFSIDMLPEHVWGVSRVQQAIGVLSNMLGVASVANVDWYQSAWWFVSFAILLYFAIPIIHIIVKRIGPIASLIFSVFLVRTLQFNVTYDGLPRYLICVVLGITFAEYSLFERVEEEIKDKYKKLLLFGMLILGSGLCIVLIKYVTCGYIREAMFVTLIALLAVIYIGRVPVINTLLAILGEYSDYMWLIHLFVYKHLFKDMLAKYSNIWLVWGLVVLFSFALSFVLKNIQRAIEHDKFIGLLNSTKGKMLFSVISVLLLICFIWFSTGFAYLTNDDTGIQSTLSGETTGTPYITHQFINVILGFIVSSLYKISQSVQWWFVYSLLLMSLGVFLINYSIVKRCVEKQLKGTHIIGIIIVSLLICLYPVSRISFTMVPAVLGTGLVAFLFSMDEEVTEKKYKWTILLVIIGYVFVLIHRLKSGYALLCFILMGVLYFTIIQKSRWKDIIKNFVCICIGFFVITGIIVAVHSVSLEKINGKDFVEYNAARISYMDYPKDKYEDNPELYKEVGWDQDTYNLVRNWCFLDESVTAESFAYLSENSNADYDMESYLNIVKTAFSSEGCQILFVVWGCTLLCVFYLILCNRKGMFILFTCFNNLGAFILIVYQIWIGRLIYRSLFVVLLPAIVVNIILSIRYGEIKKADSFILKPIILCMVVFSGVLIFSQTYNKEVWETIEVNNERTRTIKQYAIEHPEKTFMMYNSVYNQVDCYTTYIEGAEPCNLIMMGGSTYNSDSYMKRLEVNGISELNCDTFKLEDKYYLCRINIFNPNNVQPGNSFTFFYDYLKSRTNVVGFVLDEKIMSKAYSYQFVFEDNKDQFDKWYDIVDGKVVAVEAQ